jgi:hypothetical protein
VTNCRGEGCIRAQSRSNRRIDLNEKDYLSLPVAVPKNTLGSLETIEKVKQIFPAGWFFRMKREDRVRLGQVEVVG